MIDTVQLGAEDAKIAVSLLKDHMATTERIARLQAELDAERAEQVRIVQAARQLGRLLAPSYGLPCAENYDFTRRADGSVIVRAVQKQTAEEPSMPELTFWQRLRRLLGNKD